MKVFLQLGISVLLLIIWSNPEAKAGYIAQNETQEATSNNSMDFQSNQSLLSTDLDSIIRQIEVLKQACRIAEEQQDYDKLLKAYLNLGDYYQKQYRYELAIELFFDALVLCDSLDNMQDRARVQHEIGSVYLEIRNLDLAHEYLSKSLELKRTIDNKKDLAITLNSIALTYWLQGKLDTALNYLFQTLQIEQNFSNNDGISRCYNNIGIVYHEKGQYPEALSFLKRALEIKRGTNDYWAIAETLNNIGEAYISQKNYKEAIEVLKEAQSISKELNALVLLSDNYRYFSRLYKRTNNYKEALKYHELFTALEDSLFSRDKFAIISELKSSFEIEKKENALQLQGKKIELLEERKKIDRLQKVIMAAFVAFFLIIGAIIYNRQKKINFRNKQLLEKDKQIQKAQALLVENERQENERLGHELEQKNKFLTDFALFIGMKNDLLFQVKNKLKSLARRNNEYNELRPIVQQLNQSLRHNTELVGFQENVEKVNIDFIQALIEKYPDITENEKQLAIFLRLNISSKEIADFRAVSLKAIEMSRYRLRKKLNLGKNDSLRKYIQSI